MSNEALLRQDIAILRKEILRLQCEKTLLRAALRVILGLCEGWSSFPAWGHITDVANEALDKTDRRKTR